MEPDRVDVLYGYSHRVSGTLVVTFEAEYVIPARLFLLSLLFGPHGCVRVFRFRSSLAFPDAFRLFVVNFFERTRLISDATRPGLRIRGGSLEKTAHLVKSH